jgi:acyl-[acyl-carrier-protein] desaturase
MTVFATNRDMLCALEPVVAQNLNRHLSTAKDWNPHDYVPWSDGRDYRALGGEDWRPEESKLSEVARVAMITNLLTEDNLPSYHREIAMNFGHDDAWGAWVDRWTAEENRHGIALRDYLVVTRGCDPLALEQARVAQMTAGFSPGQRGQWDVSADSVQESLTYVTFQELATRVSHRNTGRACNDPVADQLLLRISQDENLHMLVYRNLMEAALELEPDQGIAAINKVLENFTMPGYSMPGFRRNAVVIAVGGIYDPRQHLDDVVLPVLRKWRIFERNDVTGAGEQHRDNLAATLQRMDGEALRFEETKARYLDRKTRSAGRKAGRAAVAVS